MIRKYAVVLMSLLLLFGPIVGTASAGVSSNSVAVPVQLSIPESISLTLSASSITLSNASPQAQVTLTAGWQILSNTHSSATIYSYFSTYPVNGLVRISSDHFTTSYNGGSSVVCNQHGFAGTTLGVPDQDCGTFQLTQNVATDTNDSQSVVLTVTALSTVFDGSIPVGNFQGGVLNIVFQII